MATYIQGTQEYIPKVQPYKPDFNFMNNVLSQKQSMYDAGKKELSNLYGSILNSAMTREDNIEARDDFFKQIDSDIQKMAGMDLSKSSNVAAAKQIFTQLLDDKAIAHDMAWTENFNKQVSRNDMLKAIGKTENGDMWWEGGERLLAYSKEEFKNATAEDALRMGGVEYVPAKDIYGMALKIAKDNDLEVKVEQSNGRYIYTMKNGQVAYESFGQLFMGVLGNDPTVQKYYQSKAMLDMKDFAHANLETYGSLENAENAYINQVGEQAQAAYEKMLSSSEKKSNESKAKVKRIEEQIDVVAENDMERDEMAKMLSAYQEEGLYLDETYNFIKSKDGALVNPKFNRGSILSMMAMSALSNDLMAVTKTVADMNSSIEMKEDPYGLAAVKHYYDLETAYVNYQYDIMKESMKNGGSEGSASLGDFSLSDYEGATTEATETSAYDTRAQHLAEVQENVTAYQKALTDEYLRVLEGEVAEGSEGSLAKSHYVSLISAGMSSSGAFNIGNTQDGEYLSARSKFQKEMQEAGNDTDKQYEICRKYSDSMKNNVESWHMMSDYIMKNFDPNETNNKLLTGGNFKALWSSDQIQSLKLGIKQQSALVKQYKEAYGREREDIMAGIMADDTYGDERERWNTATMYGAYHQKDGTHATLEQYYNNLLDQGWCEKNNCSEEDVREFAVATYRGNKIDVSFPIASSEERITERFLSNNFEENDGGWIDWDVNPGIIDFAKQAYTKYSKNNADLEGQGQTWGRALTFLAQGDAKGSHTKYNGQVTHFLEQARDQYGGYAKAYLGGLALEPDDELGEEDAYTLISTIMSDLSNRESKESYGIRYADVAQGNANMVGLEISLPVELRNKYKTNFFGGNTAPSKVTIYMDKDHYDGAFKEICRSNALDDLMKIQHYISLDTDTDITKDVRINKSERGGYYISGMTYNGETKRYFPFTSTMYRRYEYASPAEAYSDWNNVRSYIRALAKN